MIRRTGPGPRGTKSREGSSAEARTDGTRFPHAIKGFNEVLGSQTGIAGTVNGAVASLFRTRPAGARVEEL